jgi:hypothetical protein
MSSHEKVFLTDGYFTCPAGVYRVETEGCGGGGGGGGGAQGGTSTSQYSAGGGGGGGALLQRSFVTTIPGQVYWINIGLGGTGGSGGTGSGDNGTNGGDTLMRIFPALTTVCQYKGALGGVGGDLATSGTAYKLAMGGSPTDQRLPPCTAGSFASGNIVTYCFGPGFGGEGTAGQPVQVTRKGAASIQGFAGGSGGSYGNDSGSPFYPGGGAGGGGAGGPYGVGGTGITGADGQVTNGDNCNAAGGIAGNLGSGGGGGGGGGSGGSTGGTGSAGLSGSTGKFTIRWYT